MEHTKLKSAPYRKTRRGIALILVLMLVVLATIMMVAFFLSVQTESKSTRSVVAGQSSKQLADTAVQSVIAQIQQATTQGTAVAWASQPGMIRTYDNTGAARNWYKLYSASSSVVAPGSETLTLLKSDVPTTVWATAGSANYGVFTDINSPAYASDGSTLVYPVVDPSGATTIATANGTAPVLGFDLDLSSTTTPWYTAKNSVGDNASPSNNPAAMPVRWLYVLSDGQQVPAVAGSIPGTVNVTGATTKNPIVGRVAYWTDDETSKVNINTAADGTYYDTPRFSNVNPLTTTAIGALATTGSTASQSSPTKRDLARINDLQFAVAPPFAEEFQRYIGHPAQTRLSYIISDLARLDLVSRSQLGTQLAPFMQWGGSQGGIQTEYEYLVSGSTTKGDYSLTAPLRQTPYATLDEWMFSTRLNSSLRVPNAGSLPSSTNTSPGPLLTNTRLQQLRFFLSANSEGPEVNLYGQPRLSMWPISSDLLTDPQSAYTTAFDRMIAKAATLTPSTATINNYYFNRTPTGANSPYLDFTGATTSTAYNTASPTTRNQKLFSYLRTFASTAVPGYGGAFSSKYGAPEMDQILTEIFDYCRSTNPSDDLLAWGKTYDQRRQDVSSSTYSYSGSTSTFYPVYDGIGQVTPICLNIDNTYLTKGFGRFCSISDLAIAFTRSQEKILDATGVEDTAHVMVTAVIYFGLYTPSLGPGMLTPDMRVEILPAGLNAMSVSDGTSTFNPFTGPSNSATGNTAKTTYSAIPIVGGGNTQHSEQQWHCDNGKFNLFQTGGAIGPRQLFAYFNSTMTPSIKTTDATTTPKTIAYQASTPNPYNYSFCGVPMPLSATGNLSFSAPTQLEIRIYNNRNQNSANQANGNGYPGDVATELVQTFLVNVPSFTSSQLPTFTQRLYDITSGTGLTRSANSTNYSGRSPLTRGDVVRSLVSGYNGDMRLVAAQQKITQSSVPATTDAAAATAAFVKHPNYDATATAMAHSLRDAFPKSTPEASQNPFQQAGFSSAGQLVADASYKYATVNGAVSHAPASFPPDVTGDWDNGVGAWPDGPYINKADEAGSQFIGFDVNGGGIVSSPPYYSGQNGGAIQAYSSPNRAMASPVMFGSLPTGVPLSTPSGGVYPTTPATPIPWQTLLFRPQAGHPGGAAPGDKLLLDWFWVPVVEPYALSTTLATAGKVNLNYQIAPFTYMTRSSALMSVLGSEQVIAVPTTAGQTYKSISPVTPATPYRTPVKVLENDNVTPAYTTGTLRPFQDRFALGKIFKSAAEICDIYLVPQGESWTSWAPAGSPTAGTSAETFWGNNKLTGDNSRERPYNGLYSRLTTKSNTYTVHVRAQALKTPKGTPDGTWVENSQLIASEYRGSVTINRYLDPQDPNIPDFAAPANALKYSLDSYYKYRVLETRRFLP